MMEKISSTIGRGALLFITVFALVGTSASTNVVAATAAVSSASDPSSTTAAAVYHPSRIPYESLVNDELFWKNDNSVQSVLLNALSEVGMVSITGIFGSGGDNGSSAESSSKTEMLTWLHQCSIESDSTQLKTFHDGTVRNTMATVTIPSQNVQIPIEHHRHSDSDSSNNNNDGTGLTVSSSSCEYFAKSSETFRSTVTEVTTVLTKRLMTVFGIEHNEHNPLLLAKSTDDDNAKKKNGYDSLSDIVEHGQHLEHFHSYQKTTTTTTKIESLDENRADDIDENNNTIQWHIDQGLMLVFTPGRKVQRQQSSDEVPEVLTDGLYIQLQDGSRARVVFDDSDDLVFMLGDGVNQYINPRLADDKTGLRAPVRPLLRATPHALRMPTLASADEARVWYGRMVLPPDNAVHPLSKNGMTFGEIRSGMIQATEGVRGARDNSDAVSESEGDGSNTDAVVDTNSSSMMMELGCSSGMVARNLASSCSRGTVYCWHTCMKPAQYKVSPTSCKQKKQVLGCGNKKGQKWDGKTHGDWYLRCLKP